VWLVGVVLANAVVLGYLDSLIVEVAVSRASIVGLVCRRDLMMAVVLLEDLLGVVQDHVMGGI
jgi:hypothetical protein